MCAMLLCRPRRGQRASRASSPPRTAAWRTAWRSRRPRWWPPCSGSTLHFLTAAMFRYSMCRHRHGRTTHRRACSEQSHEPRAASALPLLCHGVAVRNPVGGTSVCVMQTLRMTVLAQTHPDSRAGRVSRLHESLFGSRSVVFLYSALHRQLLSQIWDAGAGSPSCPDPQSIQSNASQAQVQPRGRAVHDVRQEPAAPSGGVAGRAAHQRRAERRRPQHLRQVQ